MSGPPPFLQRSSNQSGDIRAVALSAHNKAQDVWGKKKAASAYTVLDQIEPERVEGYALDYAIRQLWNLQRNDDELVQCKLSIEITKKLRNIVLDVLAENQSKFTKEYEFEIADPEKTEEREREKREKAIQNAKERLARREEVEREKKEREEKMRLEEEKQKKEEEERAKKEQEEEKQREENESTPTSTVEGGEKDAEGEKEKKRKKKKKKEGSQTDKGEKEKKSSRKRKSTKEEGEEKTKKRKKKTSSKIKSSEGEETGDEKDKKKKSRKKAHTTGAMVNGGIKRMSSKSKIESKEEKKEEAEQKTEETTTTAAATNNDSTIAKSSARARRRTTGTGPPKGARPLLKRGGDVVLQQEEPIPKINIKKTLVDLENIHTLIEEKIQSEFPNPMEVPASIDNDFLDFYHLSVKGPRPSNEDEYTVIEHVNELLDLSTNDNDDKYSYIAVYDGHSGKYTSLYTRSQLHNSLFKNGKFPDDEAFKEAFEETDRFVNEFQHRQNFSCGTTALSVCIKNNRELIIGNVGDCRGFLCRDGLPLEIAVPHNLDREDEKKRIEALGGAVVCYGTWRVNGILAVSRSIGDYNLRALVISEPDVTRIELQKSDEFLIIASDGLWDGINGEEMIEVVKGIVAEHGREYVCKALCDLGIERNTKDNVTVVALFFNQDKAP